MLEVDRAFTEGERASLSDYGLTSVRWRRFLVNLGAEWWSREAAHGAV